MTSAQPPVGQKMTSVMKQVHIHLSQLQGMCEGTETGGQRSSTLIPDAHGVIKNCEKEDLSTL